jgi:hypothetical protein
MLILVVPSGGKSNVDYKNEKWETKDFTLPGFWSGGKGSEKLRPGDMFAFVDSRRRMQIHQILDIWTQNLDAHKRPWWIAGAYELKAVIKFGPLFRTVKFNKYLGFHKLSDKTPAVGRAVHEWIPGFEKHCFIPATGVADVPENKTAPPEQERITGWVYFIEEQPSSGWIKIGCTKNDPLDRIPALQTGNPRRLKLLTSVSCADYKKFEGYLHKCFEAKRGEGEWFQLLQEDILQLTKFLQSPTELNEVERKI